ncbi:MAG: site-specific recombinase [Micromonosporaceae bacterium]|nr:site-specific recombinase [Micromonosporaceae bacterium]
MGWAPVGLSSVDRSVPVTGVLHDDGDLLAGWASRPKVIRRSRGNAEPDPGSLRFAFYGRTSTSGFQDRVSSQQWQVESAWDLIAGRGVVVAEFFDVGYSRRLPWAKRPQAAALLATIADPNRGFDAVVVGEYERAFYADQLLHLAVLFDQHGVQLWLPETNGPVNHRDSAHQALVMLLGAQSRREVLRSRFRVTRRCVTRRGSKDATLGAVHPMATDTLMLVRTRTRFTHCGGGGCDGSNPIRRPQQRSSGSLASGWPDRALRRLPARSMTRVCRVRPSWILFGTGIELVMDGRCERLRRYSRIPAIRAGRCGTVNAPTTTSRDAIASRVGGRCCGGTRPTSGLSPKRWRIRRWSARPISSPPSTSTPSLPRVMVRPTGTCSSDWCDAGAVSAGWTRSGCTVVPDIGAVTGPLPRIGVECGERRPSTYVRTASSIGS